MNIVLSVDGREITLTASELLITWQPNTVRYNYINGDTETVVMGVQRKWTLRAEFLETSIFNDLQRVVLEAWFANRPITITAAQGVDATLPVQVDVSDDTLLALQQKWGVSYNSMDISFIERVANRFDYQSYSPVWGRSHWDRFEYYK